MRGEEGCPLGAFLDPSWDGGEGWEEAVHMPTSVTYVTEEHFSSIKVALAYLTLGVRVWEGLPWGLGGGGMDTGGDEAWCLRK